MIHTDTKKGFLGSSTIFGRKMLRLVGEVVAGVVDAQSELFLKLQVFDPGGSSANLVTK
jgi:hypothetical protein